jgi:hypothetical protein
MNRLGGIFVACVLAVPAFLAVLGAEYSTLPTRFGLERRFVSGKWKAQADRWPVRLNMVRDLLRRHPLVGLTRAQVMTLLGPPLAGDHKFQDHDMVYWLSIQRTLIPLDSEWLVIDFGPDGRVKSAEVVGD